MNTQDADIPEDIKKAREMLSEFERATEANNLNIKETRMFREALELLNNHPNSCFNCPHNQVIQNIKNAYTRSLINILDFITPDSYGYLDIRLILMTLDKEIKHEIEKSPPLKEKYDRYIELFSKEWPSAEEVINKHKKNEEKES